MSLYVAPSRWWPSVSSDERRAHLVRVEVMVEVKKWFEVGSAVSGGDGLWPLVCPGEMHEHWTPLWILGGLDRVHVQVMCRFGLWRSGDRIQELRT